MKRNRKRIFCLLLLLSFLAVSCGTREAAETENSVKLYMMNLTGTGMTPVSYQPVQIEPEEAAWELLERLQTMEDQDRYAALIPENITVQDLILSDDGELTLFFSPEYQNLSGTHEILIRAGIVRTLVQIEGVTGVLFYIGDTTLTDGAGSVVGTMSAESFVDYVGDDTAAMQEVTLLIYYASTDGTHLLPEERNIYYNASVTPERLALEYLKEKPSDPDAQTPLPASTRVLSVVTKDSICHVDLDSSFLTAIDGVSQNISVYAIVNTLTGLEGINGVQISIDGSPEKLVLNGQSVTSVFTRDLSLVVGADDGVEDAGQENEIQTEVTDAEFGETEETGEPDEVVPPAEDPDEL